MARVLRVFCVLTNTILCVPIVRFRYTVSYSAEKSVSIFCVGISLHHRCHIVRKACSNFAVIRGGCPSGAVEKRWRRLARTALRSDFRFAQFLLMLTSAGLLSV